MILRLYKILVLIIFLTGLWFFTHIPKNISVEIIPYFAFLYILFPIPLIYVESTKRVKPVFMVLTVLIWILISGFFLTISIQPQFAERGLQGESQCKYRLSVLSFLQQSYYDKHGRFANWPELVAEYHVDSDPNRYIDDYLIYLIDDDNIHSDVSFKIVAVPKDDNSKYRIFGLDESFKIYRWQMMNKDFSLGNLDFSDSDIWQSVSQ